MKPLLALVLLARVASADANLLGTRIAFGTLPVDGGPMTTMSLGVSLDRPLAGRLRALAEYEHLWIDEGNLDDHTAGVASLAHSGHRLHLGLRHRLGESHHAGGMVQLFLDAEAGGGAMLVDRGTPGGEMSVDLDALAVPHAFAGIRLGLALDMSDAAGSGPCGRTEAAASSVRWEYEVVVRAIATSEGVGGLVGIGLVWGDRVVAKGNAVRGCRR